MATVGDLILRAQRLAGVIGIGQTADAEDAKTAREALNDLLAQWQVQRWLVYGTVTNTVVSTGAKSYTIGTGGDFNQSRPDRIESAYMRFLSTNTSTPVDLSLSLITAREDYNALSLKELGSIPNSVFYDNSYPIGKLYFWPVPLVGVYGLYITTKVQLQNFPDLTTAIQMPPEYISAMRYELASILRVEYQLGVDPKLEAMVMKSQTVLRNANAQIGTLRMPTGIPGGRAGWYNPYSDGTR